MSDNFFVINLKNLLSIYPIIFNEIFDINISTYGVEKIIQKKSIIVLPSDIEWKNKCYQYLLEKQKQIQLQIEKGIIIDEKKDTKTFQWESIENDNIQQNNEKLQQISRSDYPERIITSEEDIIWSFEIVAKAGKLLRKPAYPVCFNDELEMRNAYTLIYDVYRYKTILSQALNDVQFFKDYSELKQDETRVWLLFFELYTRQFRKIRSKDAILKRRLFEEADLEHISKCLWKSSIQLAAAIARIRIKNRALCLSNLLPPHLQNQKMILSTLNPIITGWLNPFKIKNKKTAVTFLQNLGLMEVHFIKDEEIPLKQNQFKWDKICPLFMSCIPDSRINFIQSEFVRQNYFIIQDRAFSLGPALISHLLDFFELDGDIVQTHVSSPRSTAYLAALFYSVNRMHNFIVFGVGRNFLDYQNYVETLGANNIRLYSEKFCNISLESPILQTVVGILASPPNSYSGVTDPIDLICSRGGDLSMLEVLTESELSDDNRYRITKMLEEQHKTLCLAMSRPQVQFILYETHSTVACENDDMVKKAVEDINKDVFEKHLAIYKEKKRLDELADKEMINIPGGVVVQQSSIKKSKNLSANEMKTIISNDKELSKTLLTNEDISKEVNIPNTDEFLVISLSDIYENQEKCLDKDKGCFLSLIQRKEITRLDAKLLIKMAEARGLFGSGDDKITEKSRNLKKNEKKTEDNSDKKKFNYRNFDQSWLERINAPTHSSINRANAQRLSNIGKKSLKFDDIRNVCKRHCKHHYDDFYNDPLDTYLQSIKLTSRAKRWWIETTKYIKKTNFGKKINNKNSSENLAGPLVSTISSLKLPRNYDDIIKCYWSKQIQRNPYPVTVSQVEFNLNTNGPDKSSYEIKKKLPITYKKNTVKIKKPISRTSSPLASALFVNSSF